MVHDLHVAVALDHFLLTSLHRGNASMTVGATGAEDRLGSCALDIVSGQ